MKVKTTLPNGDFYVHIIVVFDLVVLACVLTILSSDIVPRFGFSVRTPPSQFLMDNASGEKYVVAVTAGESPVVFLDNRRLEYGLAELEQELDRIVAEHSDSDISRVGIILVMDLAVSRETEQKLVDMVLTRNMSCSIAADPKD